MFSRGLTSGVLMDVSESWISEIRQSDSADIRMVVDRLFDRPVTYSRWLSFHYDLMKKVAASQTPMEQLILLRKTSFSLVHRQALFDHLRTAQVTGPERKAVFAALHGSTSYTKAVLSEHSRYLESNSSLFCTDRLEFFIRHDAAFSAALADYRPQYMDFFGVYCNWAIAESRGDEFPMALMIPELKAQLLTLQRQIVAMPIRAAERRWTGPFH